MATKLNDNFSHIHVYSTPNKITFLSMVTIQNLTFHFLRILLNLDKTTENFNYRSLLKNQGHWLGLMLLARNKPILMVDLDMKQLIIEVGFVCVVFVAQLLYLFLSEIQRTYGQSNLTHINNNSRVEISTALRNHGNIYFLQLCYLKTQSRMILKTLL